MNIGTIVKVFGVIILLFVQGVSTFAEEKDLEKSLKDAETQIQDNLCKYDQEKQISFLQKAHKVIEGINVHFEYKGWETRVQRVFELELQLLNTCFTERDYTYNLDNPPTVYINVSPPLWAIANQPNLTAGIRPEDVIDPKARKQYEAAIAENNRKKEKDTRERKLQDIIDSEMLYIVIWMMSVRDNPERQHQMLNSLDALIESKILREKIMDAFEERVEKRKKANKQR